ncbi:glyoxalase [Suipraeoptans intestinalis]|uniref:Glyoxalase n=1 Tax=Suipraeoptans intestinalis TaxID=2606628 RepID=A0A6N7UT35_9FIRM|nr:glyoxalase [Suipraeoptans intestinalis]MDD7769644.1 glyoxalase [Suipraeoptans intestinalis]MDY3121545.1 glyoxalase [Suipraeoptans intestinalis]MSR94503.1 glyoxalase [Suipraeoptans intestinalis]
MYQYDEECIAVFLRDQGQLFDEPVAETPEEAETFLEDCMALIAGNIQEVREILSEEGMDVDGMTNEELEEAAEIFPLSGGRYLIVEG